MKRTLRTVDNILNQITMYRLLLYGLIVVIGIAVVFCFTGVLSLSGGGLLLAAGILLAVCYSVNRLLASLYHAASNSESSLITALILTCILPQPTSAIQAWYIALAGMLAIASKYVLSWHHKHLFNPAAAGAAIMALTGLFYATWWIGNPSMLPFVCILGILVVRKLRYSRLLIIFLIASFGMSILMALVHSQAIASTLHDLILSGPLIFLGTIMLTEPSTMPPSSYYQLLYGLIVAVLFTAQLKLGSISFTPELALITGNIFAYTVSFKRKIRMTLQKKRQLSSTTYDFAFQPDQPFAFKPGQYLEWTLPHHHVDQRGNRRTFTIASSPTEQLIHLGVKFYKPSSSFKSALLNMQPGDSLVAGQLAGDFTLPFNTQQKLVWIAGGIGITPFRSMAQFVIDNHQKRDIVLFYVVSQADELNYVSILQAARENGIRMIPVVSKIASTGDWQGHSGRLTTEMLKQEVPDFTDRIYYVSGPNNLVQFYTDMLRSALIPAGKINSDFFSGY